MICPACQTENDTAADMCFKCGRGLTGLTQGALIAGRYEILETLGRGGMGMVYKARDRTLDEVVAIKVLRPGFAGSPELERRFLSEIKLARQVSHRNVCRIHEYGEHEGVHYLSMALVEGADLKQLLREKGALPPDEALDAAIQVAEGLQAIHDEGIIHRDLKTGNMIRDAKGVVRLLDFGIAKRTDGEGESLTATGLVVGTPDYLSPEQALGKKADTRSDLYSLGVVIFELLTGRLPFKGDSALSTLQKHLHEPPPLEGAEAAKLPRPVVPILRRALAKDPALRYASARDMGEALRAARASLASAGATTQRSPATLVAPDAAATARLEPKAERTQRGSCGPDRSLPPGPRPALAKPEPERERATSPITWLALGAALALVGIWMLRSRPPAEATAPVPVRSEPAPQPPLVTLRELPPATSPPTLARPTTTTLDRAIEPTPTPAPVEPRDPVAADREACDRGEAEGCFAVGERFRAGRGLPQDPDRALAALERACDRGLPKACGRAGFLLLRGDGVRQDLQRGTQLVRQACESGYAPACQALEQMKRQQQRPGPRRPRP